MKSFAMAAHGWVLAGCYTAATRDESSIRFEVPAGSKQVLIKVIEIPAGWLHIMLQKGQATGRTSIVRIFRARAITAA
jgi:hypothetical protein